LNAAFVTALYRIIGIEFGMHGVIFISCLTMLTQSPGAYFVQAVVAQYDTHHEALLSSEALLGDAVDKEVDTEQTSGGKEASNLLVLLTALYSLQLVSCVLLYDLVRDLLAGTGPVAEANVELLLKVLRSTCLFVVRWEH
jgi:nucleolar MIF4G domain-containing protein 1